MAGQMGIAQPVTPMVTTVAIHAMAAMTSKMWRKNTRKRESMILAIAWPVILTGKNMIDYRSRR